MQKRPTTVLLADDHTMFREGLVALLTSYGGLEVVGETTNDQGAVALAREKKPDVVIMQVQMPFEKARGALDQMCAVEPAPKVVIVTMFEDPALMRDFLRLGISGYVLKSSSSRHLVGALFDPEEGNVVVGMPREMLEEAEGGSEDADPAEAERSRLPGQRRRKLRTPTDDRNRDGEELVVLGCRIDDGRDPPPRLRARRMPLSALCWSGK